MSQATVFNNNPADQAKKFEDAGFEYLHVIDLNGAFAGNPVNQQPVQEILSAVKMPVQLGGGIRNLATIEGWLNLGIARVILGTAALKDPQLVKTACKNFPNQVVVGIDAKDKMVATEGWAQVSDITAIELAQKFEDAGAAGVIYTDISRDGTMTGPNIEQTVELAQAINIPVILSGGISSTQDVLDVQAQASLEGVIIGRALYDGMIDVEKILS